MIVPPPDDYDGIEIDILFADELAERLTEDQYAYIKELMSRPPWRCPVCNCKNASDNEKCVYCYIRNHVMTPKP